MLLLLGAGMVAPVKAQEADSTNFRFEQQNSTFQWINTIRYHGKIGNLSYRFHNNFISTMTRIQANREQWKDDQQFRGELFGPVKGYWNWILLGSLLWYNDEQSGYFNDMRAGEAALGVRRDHPGWHLNVNTGYLQDIRKQFIDTGPTFTGEFVLDRHDFSGYNTTGRIETRLESLKGRSNKTYSTNWLVRKEFAPGVTDGLGLNISQKSRDYYLASGVIESRDEQNQQVSNQLIYNVNQPIRLRVSTDFSRRATRVTTPFLDSPAREIKDRENYNLGNSLGLDIHWGRWSNSFQLQYDIMQNLYTAQSEDTTISADRLRRQTPPDDNGNTVQMSNRMSLRIAERDSVQLIAGMTRMQYNTPDSTNYDDRDELRFNTLLEYHHLFRSGWQFLVGGEATFGHFVYLFSAKSAENHWNRVFRLFSNVGWSVDFWRWQTYAEVLANYYDYDYDDLLGQVRSLAFRHMTLQQQVYHPLPGNYQGQFLIRIQLEDQGRLDWDAFVQEIILEREIVEYEYKVAFPRWRRIRGYLGYRYQRRIDWRVQDQQRQTNERIFTTGPLLKFAYRQNNLPIISWEAAVLRVSQMNGVEYAITRMRLNASWRF